VISELQILYELESRKYTSVNVNSGVLERSRNNYRSKSNSCSLGKDDELHVLSLSFSTVLVNGVHAAILFVIL